MAKSQRKSGGCTRKRPRVRRMGMNSGRFYLARKRRRG